MTTTAEPTASASNAADRVRIAAARLRITTDAKLGRPTPQWVEDLAQTSTRDSLPRDGTTGTGPTEG